MAYSVKSKRKLLFITLTSVLTVTTVGLVYVFFNCPKKDELERVEFYEELNEYVERCFDRKRYLFKAQAFRPTPYEKNVNLNVNLVDFNPKTAIFIHSDGDNKVCIKRCYWEEQKPTEELEICTKLKHENIVKTHRAAVHMYKEKPILWIVTEYLPFPLFLKDKDEDVFLKKNPEFSAVKIYKGEERIRRIVRDVLNGLVYLHKKKIAHLDLKLENVVGSVDGNEIRYKIIDFDHSRTMDVNETTCPRKKLHFGLGLHGTFPYFPPESVKEGIYSMKNDIFCLGFMTLELSFQERFCLGFNNFKALGVFINQVPLPIPLNSNYSGKLDDFIRICMNVDRNKRPTAKDLLQHPFFTMQNQ